MYVCMYLDMYIRMCVCSYVRTYVCTYFGCLFFSCVSAHDIAPEGKYPAIFDDNSNPIILGKIKRIKSMQPKSLDEEEITRSGKYINIKKIFT